MLLRGLLVTPYGCGDCGWIGEECDLAEMDPYDMAIAAVDGYDGDGKVCPECQSPNHGEL